jgi:antitoxin MazE
MQTQVTKWGNSAAIRLSKETMKNAGFALGETLEIQVADGSIALVPAKKTENLGELLDGITPENTHGAIEWGRPRGKEIW